ncbi:hypothetical protein [Nocardioides donggukensis]|uniref:Uncharacterized protein n=1 Tax=Nocardioides donggukensis TaxID=2774019 RepID=A0A927Q1W2_9ACTN|nr:hypothetical protein [Nocardioides donggukensis]MBD8870587.1 hypothetical protein [Nocardioides donggukensis]
MHVVGGGTGVSTGAGPVTVYESLSTKGSSRASATTDQRAELHREAQRRLEQISGLHRAVFPTVERGRAPVPELAPFRHLLAAAEKQEFKRVRWWDRSGRKQARAAARTRAERWATDLLTLREKEGRAEQARLDAHWASLRDNDVRVLCSALDMAFRSTGAPVESFSAHGDETRLIVIGPGVTDMPTHKPTVTAGGALGAARLNKTETADIHHDLLAARVLLVAKQSFATGVGLRAVRIVVREPETGEFLLGVGIRREGLPGVDWNRSAWQILSTLDPEIVVKERGRTRALHAVDLSAHPAYSGFVPTD